MAKIIEGHTLDYTTEELNYFEDEMKKFRLPWITRMHKKYGVPFIRYGILPLIIFLAVTFFIYNEHHYEWIWTLDKTISLLLIFGFGGVTLISKIAETIATNRLRKRLGLSKIDFAILIIAFQITGM